MEQRDVVRIKQRHAAFWKCEVIDRPCIAVTAPAATEAPYPAARDTDEFLSDGPFNVRHTRATLAHQVLLGDTLPWGYAQGNLLYPAWGGRGEFQSGTVWVHPTVEHWTEWARYRFDFQNEWIQRYLRVNAVLAEQSRGEYLVGTQGFFGAMDAMALMRGYHDFILELGLPEAEEAIRMAHVEAIAGHQRLICAVWDDVGPYQDGTVTQPGIWAPGRINYFSADWTGLVGPKTFERWMAPELQAMVETCEYSMYHLDGPDAVRHLPIVAAVPGLNGIQFEAGPKAGLGCRIAVAREILKSRKCTCMTVAPSEVGQVLRKLPPQGLFIKTRVDSVNAGRELLRQVERGIP